MAVKKSNAKSILARLGRASTPEVEKSNFGISLGSLTKISEHCRGSVLIISKPETFRSLSNPDNYVFGVPGMLVEQANNLSIEYLIIDAESFDEGPWLDADNGGNMHLSEEIFSAGVALRTRGAVVFFIPRPSHRKNKNGSEIPRIISTSTLDLSNIPELDLEEQAPQSTLFEEWSCIARKREIHVSN